MELSDELHGAAAFPPGKEPPDTHRIQGWVGSKFGLEVLNRLPSPPAHCLVTMSVELYRLLLCNLIVLIIFGTVCKLRSFFCHPPATSAVKVTFVTFFPKHCINKYGLSAWNTKCHTLYNCVQKSLLFYSYAGSTGSESAQDHVVTTCSMYNQKF